MTVPVPKAVRERLPRNSHPGLQLDKYLEPGDGNQESQKPAITRVAELRPDENLRRSVLQRQRAAWQALGATIWQMKTAGPLALHLSRASALENAGICLHPVYGFSIIPGTGLKGLARAWAETVWLPAQKDQAKAWATIETVFGWAPESDKHKKGWKPKEATRHGDDDVAAAGEVVFHDAWPSSRPRLIVDIVNNHHTEYYQGTGNDAPPGDWENPVPVYFLAVASGVSFELALSGRDRDVAPDLIELAREWLTGALVHLGAGGKTNAGYGRLVPLEGTAPELPKAARASFEAELELVTPAFLAGANQRREDCELRPATLRGQLRWWWRAIHAGHLSVRDLRELEGALWGTTTSGGAISISIEPVGGVEPEQFDKNAARREHSLVQPPNKKTTQGLWYLAFGMDDKKAESKGGPKRRFQRWFLSPGASWKVRITARGATFRDLPVKQQLVLEQAFSALWLLCQFGGVGAKSRKGFGSLQMASASGAPKIRKSREVEASGRKLRDACDLSGGFDPTQVDSSSLNALAKMVSVDVPAGIDEWQAIDALGFSAQAFAKKYKHQREKMALGLPRKIGNPARGSFHSDLDRLERHSSPAHYHFYRRGEDGLRVLVTAFIARHLPNVRASREILRELCEHIETDLPGRFSDYSAPPNRSSGGQGSGHPEHHRDRSRPRDRGQQQRQRPPSGAPSPGSIVQAVILEEKTKKGKLKARHETTGFSGHIHNSDAVPSEIKPGDEVRLEVKSVNERQRTMDFQWTGGKK